MLSDGRFILLESEAVDLNGYVNESVEVRGSLRPTVEAGGMIMRVDQARLSVEKEDEEQPPVEEEDADDDDLEPQEEDEEETDDDTSEEGAPEQQDDNDETDDDTPTEEPTPEPSEEPPQPQQLPSPELVPRIEQMASETFTSDQWTQQYCTAHIGFCIPVHRNWWFKSFGTTTSYLWHIELSSEEVAFLNSGPIHVNLVSGTVGAKKATDGQVRAQADSIVGFRSWTDNRHFEISAPPALEEAVTYITNHLSEYEGE